jgi:hypothetical protein
MTITVQRDYAIYKLVNKTQYHEPGKVPKESFYPLDQS